MRPPLAPSRTPVGAVLCGRARKRPSPVRPDSGARRAHEPPEPALHLIVTGNGPGVVCTHGLAKRAAWNEGIAAYAAERVISPLVAGLGRQDDSLVLDGLGSLTMPVLLIVGSRDRTYHRGKRLLERSLANASLLVVDGAGHFPHRTHAPVVNAALDRFLGQIAAAPP